jgi:tetratricopeptide (TPR) repeat protein
MLFKKVFLINLSICLLVLFFFLNGNESNGKVRLFLPEKTWVMEVNIEGFKLEENLLSFDGESRRFFVSNENKNLFMSVFLEKAEGLWDSKDYREYYWNEYKRNTAKNKELSEPEEIRIWEEGEKAMLEYINKEFEGIKINQKHLHLFMTKEDIWIHIHLSKVDYKPEDEKLFREILDSVRIIDNYPFNSFDYLTVGSSFYLWGNFEKAIEYYEKALELEKKQLKLPKTLWFVLIDNLGMSYGMIGNHKKAKEIFEYGISTAPGYPMFYYNLACAYAEMGDIKNAIINLKMAYKYKDNIPAGFSELPNPRKDPSFKPYLKNKEFLKALKELDR